ncbi:MAG: ATP-binding protein [Gammaproteobacteria bacterium]|nr:ATP-binding protein [Gammaproteobacteria bacterium]
MIDTILKAFQRKTSFRVAAAASLPSLVFLVLIGSFSFWQIYESTYNQVKSALEYDGYVDARRIGETFNTIDATITTLSENPTIANGLIDSAGRETYLTPLLESFSVIQNVKFDLVLTDFIGNSIAYSGNTFHIDRFSQLIAAAITKGKSVFYIKEIEDEKYLLGINVIIYSRTQTGEGALVYLVSLDEIFVSLLEGDKQKTSQIIYNIKKPVNKVMDTIDADGITHIVTPIPLLSELSELGIALDQEIKLDEMFLPLRRISLVYILGSVVCFIIIVFISLWLGRQITRPLKALENSVIDLLVNADPVPPELLQRRDEIGSLASSFDWVIGELREMNHTLENKVEERTRDLLLARDEAVNANLAKTRFLSSMSHELRTPLTAILGFGQMMELVSDEKLVKEKKKYVHEIMLAGKQLLSLIDEVLELNQIEAGKLSVSFSNVAVDELIQETLSMNRMLADTHGIDLIDQTKAAEQRPLWTDASRLKQVLNNLISNAIKYNRESGSVTLLCEQLADDKLRISVQDVGEGLHKDQFDKLFIPFERLGREAGVIEGTGIGLTITRQVVNLLGGKMDFTSEPGKGSIFWVDIPLSRQTVQGNT